MSASAEIAWIAVLPRFVTTILNPEVECHEIT